MTSISTWFRLVDDSLFSTQTTTTILILPIHRLRSSPASSETRQKARFTPIAFTCLNRVPAHGQDWPCTPRWAQDWISSYKIFHFHSTRSLQWGPRGRDNGPLSTFALIAAFFSLFAIPPDLTPSLLCRRGSRLILSRYRI